MPNKSKLEINVSVGLSKLKFGIIKNLAFSASFGSTKLKLRLASTISQKELATHFISGVHSNGHYLVFHAWFQLQIDNMCTTLPHKNWLMYLVLHNVREKRFFVFFYAPQLYRQVYQAQMR